MAGRRVVDLTHPIEEGMPTFHAHWHPDVEVERLGTIPDVGRESRRLGLGSHTGTHIDAPLHFIEEGTPIDEVPLDALVGPVRIVDLTHLGPGEAVTADMVDAFDPAERTILRYGWEDRWSDPDDFYSGYPHLTVEGARRLVEAGVRLLGYDTPSPDDSRGPLDGSGEDSPVHKLLLGSGVVLVEYLAHLAAIEPLDGWSICALPLKVRGSDGAPARVVLFREDG